MLVTTTSKSGAIIDEHYYYRANSVEVVTIVDDKGKLRAKYKRADRYEGYDWYEDYRKQKYGSEV